ncbi:hypothetical protein ACP4OV_001176 [Aristida adscensionis]
MAAAMDSAARPDEEEARRRRNTDCIYFLASPLTCKKGSECEYRHSDAARMNPRDCWYWFNGNCANPKCSFRHPPLDGVLGAPTTPQAAQQSAPQVSVPVQAHGSVPAGGTAKQGVPCYYFQKGMCAKGNRCAFLHVPQAAGNPAPQQTTKVFPPALQPHPQPKNSWTKPNSTSQQNTPPGTDGKPSPKQNLTIRGDHSSGIYQNHGNSYAHSGSTKHYRSQPSVEGDLAEKDMEVGECMKEPSAGSGARVGGVDDNTEQTFKGNHSSYHRINGEQHTGMVRQTHGSYESERSYRSPAERMLSERRSSQREPMPATAGSSDLRHRLLKQRRLNDSRSSHVADRRDAYYEDERRDKHHSRGEEQVVHDDLPRSRLRGRIKLPGETSLDRLGSRSESERDRGARARLSPPKQTDLRGKLHERLKARSNEDDVKSWVAKPSSGEDAGSLNFAGPKSLAELKAKKVIGRSGKDASKIGGSSAGPVRVTSEIASTGETSETVSFEGPKPLSTILKRKREASSENASHSGSIQEEEEDPAVVEEEPQNKFETLEDDTVETNIDGNGEVGEEEEEGEAFLHEEDVAYDDTLYPVDDEAAEDAGKEQEEHQDLEAAEDYDYEAGDVNEEEGNDYHDDEAADDAGKEQEEHQDLEAAEDYDYEAGDVNAEEGNDYQYEDDDFEDDDDFSRKVGVMIT